MLLLQYYDADSSFCYVVRKHISSVFLYLQEDIEVIPNTPSEKVMDPEQAKGTSYIPEVYIC